MQLPIELPGFELHQYVIQYGGFFSAPKLLIDGEPAPRGPRAHQFLLRRSDGTEAVAQFRSLNLLDPIPQLLVDGQIYPSIPPMKWYQWLWAGLPFVLFIIGGALGGILGGLAMFINGRIFRSGMNTLLKYLASAGVTLAAAAAFFVAASAFQLSINPFMSSPETFRSEAGRFSIVTPARLTESTHALETEYGQITVTSFSGQQGSILYSVTYTDYPAGSLQQSDPDQILQESRDGANRSVGGTITADAQIALDGYPGREFITDCLDDNGQPFTIRSRIYLVEDRFYQIMVIVPRGTSLDGDIETFFTSFQLLLDD